MLLRRPLYAVLILLPVAAAITFTSVRFVMPAFGVDPAALFMEVMVPRVAATLPKRLDRFITWESISAEGSRAVFTYRLEITSHGSATREFLAQTQAQMPKNVCSQISLRSMVWLGGGLSFQFYDGRNNMLRRIDFDPGSCSA